MQFYMNYEATSMHTALIMVAYPKQNWAKVVFRLREGILYQKTWHLFATLGLCIRIVCCLVCWKD